MPCWIRGWGLIPRIYAADQSHTMPACRGWFISSHHRRASAEVRQPAHHTQRQLLASAEPHMRRNVTGDAVEWDRAWDGARHTRLVVAAGRSALIGRANLVWPMARTWPGWLILSARILVIALHSSSAAIYLVRRTTVVSSIFFHCDVVTWWTGLANGENEAGGTEQGGTYLYSRRSPADAWATSNSVNGGGCS